MCLVHLTALEQATSPFKRSADTASDLCFGQSSGFIKLMQQLTGQTFRLGRRFWTNAQACFQSLPLRRHAADRSDDVSGVLRV